MTARPIRRNAQTPDRNGKIFYTSTTSLSHISKVSGDEAVNGRRRCSPDRHNPCSASDRTVWIRKSQVINLVILGGGEKPPLHISIDMVSYNCYIINKYNTWEELSYE